MTTLFLLLILGAGEAPEDLMEPAPQAAAPQTLAAPALHEVEGPAKLSPKVSSAPEELPSVTIEAADRSLFLGKRELEFHLDPDLGVPRGAEALSKTGMEGPSSRDLSAAGRRRRPFFAEATGFAGPLQRMDGRAVLGWSPGAFHSALWAQGRRAPGALALERREEPRALSAGFLAGLNQGQGLDLSLEAWAGVQGRRDLLGPEPETSRWGGRGGAVLDLGHANLPFRVRTSYDSFRFPAVLPEEWTTSSLHVQSRPWAVSGTWMLSAQGDLGSDSAVLDQVTLSRPWERGSLILKRESGTWGGFDIEAGAFRYGNREPQGGPRSQEGILRLSLSGRWAGPNLGWTASAGWGRLLPLDFDEEPWAGLRLRLDPSLVPERVQACGGLGLEKPLGRHHLSLSLEAQKRQGLIVAEPGPLPGTSVLRNGSRGGLLLGRLEWNSDWKGFKAGLFLKEEARSKELTEAWMRPVHQGGLNLDWSWESFAVSLEWRALGPRASRQGPVSPSGRTTFRLIWKARSWADIGFEGRNLLGAGPYQPGLPEEEAHWGLTLSARI